MGEFDWREFGGRGVVITGALGIYGTWIADAFGRVGAKLCLTDRVSDGLAARLEAVGGAAGIRVNAVEPGFAAGAVLYLCSDAAAYVTGTSIAVDGGNSIGSLVVHQAKKRAL